MQFSVYFWSGCHVYLEADSYEMALEKAKQMAEEMNTAVDYPEGALREGYLLPMPS